MPNLKFAFTLSSFLCSIDLVKATNFKGFFDTTGGTFKFANPVSFDRHQLRSSPIESQEVANCEECIFSCINVAGCQSVNFKVVAEANGKHICQLLDADKFIFPELLFNGSVDFHHYSLAAPCEHSPCLNGGTCYQDNGQYDFKCACPPGVQGKRCNVSFQSCAELLNAGYDKSGVYHIKPSQSEMFSAYCDQTSRGGGWTMVFKVVSGVSADVYSLWLSADSLNENKLEALNVNSLLKEHYKNSLVQNWQTAAPREVRMTLYTAQSEILSIVFNATDSDKENWFSKDRLIDSPWTDLVTEPHLYFSVEGPGLAGKRHFYMMRNHGGCDVDAGWFVVSSLESCSWELVRPPVLLLYSKLTTYATVSVAENVGIADVFVVYIR